MSKAEAKRMEAYYKHMNSLHDSPMADQLKKTIAEENKNREVKKRERGEK